MTIKIVNNKAMLTNTIIGNTIRGNAFAMISPRGTIMSVKLNTLNKFKQYCEGYNETHDWVPDIKSAYTKTLDLLTRENVVNNTEMQAVIGFDENDNPVFWDLKKDNLLSTCAIGSGAYLFGQDLALASLDLRFDKHEFAYYVLSGEGANIWNPTNDEHCLGFWSAYSKNKAQPTIAAYLSELKNALHKRAMLTPEQLAHESFLLFVFSVPHVALQDWDKDLKALQDILNILLNHGKALNVATYYSEYFSFVFAENRRYYPFLNTFSAKLYGAGIGESYTDDVKDKYAIDSQLKKELTALEKEMQANRMHRLFAPAYFFSGSATKQKIYFANNFFNSVIERGNKNVQLFGNSE